MNPNLCAGGNLFKQDETYRLKCECAWCLCVVLVMIHAPKSSLLVLVMEVQQHVGKHHKYEYKWYLLRAIMSEYVTLTEFEWCPLSHLLRRVLFAFVMWIILFYHNLLTTIT